MPEMNVHLGDVKQDDLKPRTGGGTFYALPDADYRVTITKSTYEPTKKGDMMLTLQMQVLDAGPFAKRVIFERLCLEHSSAKVVEIAKARLKQLAIAARYPNPDFVTNSDDLHNIPVVARIVKKPANPGYGDPHGWENQIIAFMDKQENEPPAEIPDSVPSPSFRAPNGGGQSQGARDWPRAGSPTGGPDTLEEPDWI